MVNYCLDMRVSVSPDEVAAHCVNDPEFTFKLLANLAARGIDCTQMADDGYTGSQAQQQIPDFLERLARATRLVDTMTYTDDPETHTGDTNTDDTK